MSFGSAFELYNNSNIFEVGNNGTAPTFSTDGQTYCLDHIVDYHWNGGNGSDPGTIGLSSVSGTLGPWAALGSPGQNTNGRPVNWTATPPDRVLINGRYTVVDSDPETWSQNTPSSGVGFTHIWVMKYGVPPSP